MKFNLTINATTKIVKIDNLKGNTDEVTGTDYISFSRIRDELDGWWFNRHEYAEYDRKFMFADIVNLNGSAIGVTTQAEVTALLVAAIAV